MLVVRISIWSNQLHYTESFNTTTAKTQFQACVFLKRAKTAKVKLPNGWIKGKLHQQSFWVCVGVCSCDQTTSIWINVKGVLSFTSFHTTVMWNLGLNMWNKPWILILFLFGSLS